LVRERERRRGKATTCACHFGFHCPGLASPNFSPLSCWIRPHYRHKFLPCLDKCSVCFRPLNKELRRTSFLTRRPVCYACYLRQRRQEEKDKRERKKLRLALDRLAAKRRNQPVQVPVQVESESPPTEDELDLTTKEPSQSPSCVRSVTTLSKRAAADRARQKKLRLVFDRLAAKHRNLAAKHGNQPVQVPMQVESESPPTEDEFDLAAKEFSNLSKRAAADPFGASCDRSIKSLSLSGLAAEAVSCDDPVYEELHSGSESDAPPPEAGSFSIFDFRPADLFKEMPPPDEILPARFVGGARHEHIDQATRDHRQRQAERRQSDASSSNPSASSHVSAWRAPTLTRETYARTHAPPRDTHVHKHRPTTVTHTHTHIHTPRPLQTPLLVVDSTLMKVHPTRAAATRPRPLAPKVHPTRAAGIRPRKKNRN
jgi:hypothetical protein